MTSAKKPAAEAASTIKGNMISGPASASATMEAKWDLKLFTIVFNFYLINYYTPAIQSLGKDWQQHSSEQVSPPFPLNRVL
jgi:hypothetical protein